MKISVFIILSSFIFFSACKPGPEKIDNMLNEASEKIRKSDNKGAIEELTKIIGYDKENYKAYYYRANAEFNLRQTKEAIADYTKAIEIKPDYADAFFNRASCKYYLNDTDGACNDWHKAFELGKPNTGDMLNNCD
ncbi:MAG TPA: tetratricopeptide repeat protein [Bacteroidales bacterium]|nr:tetratricopeptide repeat protein [Bacteroidales bacterium]HPS15615.1 tetratricopeptide repeat protein [Bacteroidales bacterium]